MFSVILRRELYMQQVFYFVSICMTKIFPVLICSVLSISGFAQIDLRDYDTIHIRKPDAHKLIYEFNNRFFRVISIKRDKVVAEGKYRPASESSGSPNSLMGIVGGSPVPNQLYPSALVSDPSGWDWKVDLYLRGTTGNDLLKTADGRAMEVPGNLKGFWQSGSLGLIRQRDDSIAVFGVLRQPEKDSLFRSVYLATRGLQPPVDPKRKKSDEGFGLVYQNYGVFGEFKGAELKIMFYERNRTAFIFLNNELDAVFQLDYDIPNAVILRLSRKDITRVPPVLLIRKGVTEEQQADLCRLAVFCMLTAQTMR
jgi:hypothetical protein